MPGGQIIHLYCLCWNDARMLPFFFRHYDRLVDRYFIYDNGSSDASLAILRAHPRVELAHFDVHGDSFVEEERRLSDSIWLRSKGEADWVFVLDLDEHVYRPDLLRYLRRCTSQGITAIRAIGYDMISDRFPSTEQPLYHEITMGARSIGFDKFCLFNPNAIERSNYNPGRHTANPEGRVVWPDRSEVLMLHFKQLGVDYPIARSAELRTGLRQGDLDNGWGTHYSLSAAQIALAWAQIREAAVTVPGLGSRSDMQPAEFDEEYLVRSSGLFESNWYLNTYPDVREANISPLSHFCTHGWKEGRRPNFYFDCEWYLQTYPESGVGGRNPLFHYLRPDREPDLQPSMHFEPEWYRQRYGLQSAEEPLRHYLEHASSGPISPVSTFDVVEYCRRYPPHLRRLADPYQDYLERQALPVG